MEIIEVSCQDLLQGIIAARKELEGANSYFTQDEDVCFTIIPLSVREQESVQHQLNTCLYELSELRKALNME